jgi:hypothetical protein
MAGLVVLEPGVDWTATGGLFDWTLEYLMGQLTDQEAISRLREIVDNNLGSLWVAEFQPETRQELLAALRNGLTAAGERELPASTGKEATIRQLQELADLAHTVESKGYTD